MKFFNYYIEVEDMGIVSIFWRLSNTHYKIVLLNVLDKLINRLFSIDQLVKAIRRLCVQWVLKYDNLTM